MEEVWGGLSPIVVAKENNLPSYWYDFDFVLQSDDDSDDDGHDENLMVPTTHENVEYTPENEECTVFVDRTSNFNNTIYRNKDSPGHADARDIDMIDSEEKEEKKVPPVLIADAFLNQKENLPVQVLEDPQYMGFNTLICTEPYKDDIVGWTTKPCVVVTDEEQIEAIRKLLALPHKYPNIMNTVEMLVLGNPENEWISEQQLKDILKTNNETMLKRFRMFSNPNKPKVVFNYPQMIQVCKQYKTWVRLNPVYFTTYHELVSAGNFQYNFGVWDQIVMKEDFKPAVYFYKHWSPQKPENKLTFPKNINQCYRALLVNYENTMFCDCFRILYNSGLHKGWHSANRIKSKLIAFRKHIYRLQVFADNEYPSPVQSRPQLLFVRVNKKTHAMEMMVNPVVVDVYNWIIKKDTNKHLVVCR